MSAVGTSRTSLPVANCQMNSTAIRETVLMPQRPFTPRTTHFEIQGTIDYLFANTWEYGIDPLPPSP